jgi:hypothetical protein
VNRPAPVSKFAREPQSRSADVTGAASGGGLAAGVLEDARLSQGAGQARLRSLLLALRRYVSVARTPPGLLDALSREGADELLPEHHALLGPGPARIIGSPGSAIH